MTRPFGGINSTQDMDTLYPVLINDILLSGAAANFDFTSIPSTHKHLELRYYLRSEFNGAGEGISVRFNNDSGANYDYSIWYDASSSARGTIPAVNQTYMQPTFAAGNTAPANYFAHGTIWINNYAETVGYKFLQVRGLNTIGATANDIYLFDGSGTWKSTSAINRITIASPTGANFVAGSRISLYGIN